MGWKKLPYWLKGGIVAVIFLVLFNILLFLILDSNDCLNDMSTATCPVTSNLSNIISFPSYFISSELFSAILIELVFYFVLGAFIGWIYGKMRAKRVKNGKTK